MSLKERLGNCSNLALVSREDSAASRRECALQELKGRVHYKVIEQMDLSLFNEADQQQAEKELETVVRMVLGAEPDPISRGERETLVHEIKNEVLGLGPLEPLLADPTVNDILVNNYQSVYVERQGRLERASARFRDDQHLLKIIDKIATSVGRRIDESSPMVDARLADGSRVNAIIPPLALDGPSLSIRKFAVDPLKVDDLVRLGTLSPQAAKLLQAVVKARLNVLISGGTGTGKTTLLNVMSSSSPRTNAL